VVVTFEVAIIGLDAVPGCVNALEANARAIDDVLLSALVVTELEMGVVRACLVVALEADVMLKYEETGRIKELIDIELAVTVEEGD